MIGDPFEAHYTALGKLTANWSALESQIASSIWQIGEIPDEIGASITSQIYTLDGKVNALLSILRLRGFEKEAGKLNVFRDKKLRVLQEFRNRRMHDPVRFTPNGIERLQITANKTLKMSYVAEDWAEIASKVDDIADAIDEFGRIIRPALNACPPLPMTSLQRPA